MHSALQRGQAKVLSTPIPEGGRARVRRDWKGRAELEREAGPEREEGLWG